MEYLILLCVIVVILAAVLSQRGRDHIICTLCGFRGRAEKHTRGSIFIEIILWLALLVPGLIYSIWRMTTREEICPLCRKPAVIPEDSPRGRELIRQAEAGGASLKV